MEKMDSAMSRKTMERSVSPYLSTSLTHPVLRLTKLSNSPLNDIFEGNSSTTASGIPSATSLNAIADGIKAQVLNIIQDRDEASDQMMRELALRKKERNERDRMRELEQAKRDAFNLHKKEKAKERPMALGAHAVAKQDNGSNAGRATTSPLSPTLSQPPSASLQKPKDMDADSDEEDDEGPRRQPPPATAMQHYQYFGDDPTEFPDPTVYDIVEVTPDMTDDERRKIYSVAHFPPSDLIDLTAGIPPDRDFSSAKPTNQVTAQTFANYVEPYLRPLTQEDLAFLTERGDRSAIFEIPKRGLRHYKDQWAEEDGLMDLDGVLNGPKIPTNEARGGIEMMNDDVAESDEVSTGPVAARVLSLLRPVTRPLDEQNLNGTEMEIDTEAGAENGSKSQQPATRFPESTWKNVPPPIAQDYPTLDTRLVEELRHIGFLSSSDAPGFADVQDDEVTARLRYLQRELRRISILNGARKARVLELANERMASQEWQGIMDDLDTQLNQAYLKRNRNIGKGKKQVKGRPSVGTAMPLGSAMARGAGVGEPIRSLMERREQWNDLIGPVVDHGKVTIPKASIFDKENVGRLIKQEQENWVDDEDADDN
jgi:transcriptional adapter 3